MLTREIKKIIKTNNVETTMIKGRGKSWRVILSAIELQKIESLMPDSVYMKIYDDGSALMQHSPYYDRVRSSLIADNID